MAKNSAININSSSSVIVTDGDGVLSSSEAMTNGQLLIGSTGAKPVAASLIAGSGIALVPGAGSLTIAATGGSGSGGLINIQYLTESGTYTATPGTVSCLVLAVGGGGAGGGISLKSSTASSSASASGGSGGAFGQKYYAVAPTGSSYVIGAGGVGVSNGNGTSGGATTFNDGDMNLGGGGGGGIGDWYLNLNVTNGPTFSSSFPGGVADPSDNSDFTLNGGTGFQGVCGATYGSTTSGLIGTGFGGDSMLGRGANCPVGVSGFTSYAGINATNYGAGGSGAAGQRSSAAAEQAGGNGAPGIIIVYEYS